MSEPVANTSIILQCKPPDIAQQSHLRTSTLIFGSFLTWALSTQSSRLAEAERYPEALLAAQECVALQRHLAEHELEATIWHDRALVRQLQNLAWRYLDAGYNAEALETDEEARTLERRLVKDPSRLHIPKLKRSQSLKSISELSRSLSKKGTQVKAGDQRGEVGLPRQRFALHQNLVRKQCMQINWHSSLPIHLL
ncbi:hypothetical protein DACRYDRAFT_111498 [Dacryopinax primogenitus]|uniref:Uncharacterized protein n=1 Tax=Dacryopinax primogenitus (strain DJM 731) TaxID=1858805 RepID=M5FQW2_DACPD|nr:uncharacterized protein DACRYDRAFT_111498 [Dacryopinax primogenitus]EJT97983.1 hypothetical protein DACRYDRAFT_111498 [Dacryopinax primogenitus]